MTCCRACRTFLEVCRQKACPCHQREKNLDHDTRTFKDPTANTAIRNITNNQRRKNPR